MGLLDDLAGKEPTPPAAARPVTRYGVTLDLKEEKVLLTAGEVKEFSFMIKNVGTESDQISLLSGGDREVALAVTCPRGAVYGDQLQVVVNLASKSDPAATDSRRVTGTARQAILAVKTSIGYERGVTDSIAARAKAKDIGIFSILAPDNSRGYIYVESMNPDRLEEVARSIRRARGV